MSFIFQSGQKTSNPPASPAYGSLRVNSSVMGLPVMVGFGVNAMTGTLLDWLDFLPIAQTSTQTQGGKGGTPQGGSQTTYTYQVTFLMCLGHGGENGWHSIRRMWAGKGPTPVAGFNWFLGTLPQDPWGYLVTSHLDRALHYPGLVYFTAANFSMGNVDTLPAFRVEAVMLKPWTGSYETTEASITLPAAAPIQEDYTIADPYTYTVLDYGYWGLDGGVFFKDTGLLLTRKYEENPSLITQTQETWTVADPGTHTVSQGANFCGDLGVAKPGTGVGTPTWWPLTRVSGTPGPDQYSVDANGVYTFNASNYGDEVTITYTYEGTPGSGLTTGQYSVTAAGAYTFAAADAGETVTITYYRQQDAYIEVYLGADGAHLNPPPSPPWPDPSAILHGWVQQPNPIIYDPGWDGFKEDLGVIYDTGYTPPGGPASQALTKVSGNPAKGEYSVDEVNGVYTFNAADNGRALTIDYSYWQFLGANPAEIIPEILCSPYFGLGFEASQIADLSDFSDYCLAHNLLISPIYQEQKTGIDVLTQMAMVTNSEIFESAGKLKAVPYGDAAATANGVTWTPDLSPLYDLTDDHFLGSATEDPVTISRKSQADSYNSVIVKFLDRLNEYNQTPSKPARDLADIQATGLQTMDDKTCYEITNGELADWLANILLQNSLHIKAQYKFRLGWNFPHLEAMDRVTLTTSRGSLQLNQKPVIIISAEENELGDWSYTAEETFEGVASAAIYPATAPATTTPNQNVYPGQINPPVIFVPPVGLMESPLEVWFGVSGMITDWGGVEIWGSYNNDTYRYMGTVKTPCRQGILTAPFPDKGYPQPRYPQGSGSPGTRMVATGTYDDSNTLSVDLSMSRATLLGGVEEDREQMRTLCYFPADFTGTGGVAGPALLAYRDATLTNMNQYNLTHMLRLGLDYDGMPHYVAPGAKAGTPFLRLDSAIYKMPLSSESQGQTFYFKFLSFNKFGLMRQALEDVNPYTFEIPTIAEIRKYLWGY